ncbi:MAG: hypothetical protein B0A82_17440 [Alkalinema sp. CACIAM 70d]|nr:MAG: hypothetical protein B0A82_17440 [Alkalinema sp. CACIAM 70d]
MRFDEEAARMRLKRDARHAFSRWITKLDLDWFVTLNSNCETTPDGLRRLIGYWLMLIDREALGNRFRDLPNERAFLLGWIEPATYWHCHSYIRFPEYYWDMPDRVLFPKLEMKWKEAIASGSLDIQVASVYGIQKNVTPYCTKYWRSKDFEDRLVISTEFHPQKRTDK